MNIFPYNTLVSLQNLRQIESHLSVRYIISSREHKEGKAAFICDALSYGVGQITNSNGIKLFSCQGMVPSHENLAYIIDEGEVDENWQYIDIAISESIINFNLLGFTSLMSLIAGDIFGSPYFNDGLMLFDIKLPKRLDSMFPGPQYGSNGIMNDFTSQTDKKSILGLLLKPDVGVTKEYYADLVEAAVQGGIDYIKEDELTLDSKICSRISRIAEISKRIENSKRPVLYAANVTSPPHLILECSLKAIEHGATAILVNGLQVGLDTISYLASNASVKVPIHFHRAGYDILSTGCKSISTPLLTRFFRLAGADIVHVGSPLGGLFCDEIIKSNLLQLTKPINNIKSSLPVFSRSSCESIKLITNTLNHTPSLILFDSEVYTSPKGIEKMIKNLKKMIK